MISKKARAAINTIKKEKRVIIEELKAKITPLLVNNTQFGENFYFNFFGRTGKYDDWRAYKIRGASNDSLVTSGIIGFYNGGVVNDMYVGLAITPFEDYTLKDLEALLKLINNTKALERMKNNKW